MATAVPPTILGGLTAAGAALARERLAAVFYDKRRGKRQADCGREISEQRPNGDETPENVSPEDASPGKHGAMPVLPGARMNVYERRRQTAIRCRVRVPDLGRLVLPLKYGRIRHVDSYGRL
jgi:hypothetical protein